ncbi:hypothetical protein LCGC14_1277020 [marine sediment metagenome]|uniref:Portal protein n=1 Tax=marine sediment metagenome TaxID=412755 RepID=A0A0F9LHK6_9ZZZZ
MANVILGVGTQPHDKVKELIRGLRTLSQRAKSRRYDVWRDSEDLYRSYKIEDTEDQETKAKFGVKKIIVPFTFATIQTMLHFILTIFTQSQPVLRYDGREPSDVLPARLLELLIDYDYTEMTGYMVLYNMFQSAFVYGFGAVYNDWLMESRWETVVDNAPSTVLVDGIFPIQVPRTQKRQEERVHIERNNSTVIDPYLFFPDPRVPLSNIQNGEFCGHRSFIRRQQLLKSPELYFNVTRIPEAAGTGQFDEFGGQSQINRRFDASFDLGFEFTSAEVEKQVVLDTMVVELVPNEYYLGSGTKPEKWLFGLANGEVIVRAEPSPHPHGLYPYSVVEPYPDAFLHHTPGVVENIAGLQNYLSWLFNSHMANVRKVINDIIIADPSRIIMKDLTDPERPEGAVVRLRKQAYGQDVRTMVSQLKVEDVTRGHVSDAGHIISLIQRVTAASDTIMGMPTDESKSATEVIQMQRLASARLGMMAHVFDRTGITSWKKQLAGNRQEFTSLETFMQLTGDFARELGGRGLPIQGGGVKIDRQSIQANLNYPPLPETMATDKMATARIWQGMMETVASSPEMTAEISLFALFKEAARHLGVKNIEDYKKTGALGIEAQPDADVMGGGNVRKAPSPFAAGNGPGGPRPEEYPSEAVFQR